MLLQSVGVDLLSNIVWMHSGTLPQSRGSTSIPTNGKLRPLCSLLGVDLQVPRRSARAPLICFIFCPSQMFHISVVAFGNSKIIALGGTDADGNVLKSVEVFDTSTDKWSTSRQLLDLAVPPSLPDPRTGAGAVIYKNTIYIFGGSDVDGVPLRSGFRLCLNEDGSLAEGTRWQPMPSMQHARAGFGLALAQSCCVAIGGNRVDSECLQESTRETEYLDLDHGVTALWRDGPAMAVERHYPCVVVQPGEDSELMRQPPMHVDELE